MMFSLILATRDRQHEVQEFLESVKASGWADVEVIVVDQGAEDGLEGRLETYAGTVKIRYIRKRNEVGLARARNAGMEAARGEIVAFPDDDCRYPPWLLERVAGLLRDHPDWDGVSVRSVDPKGRASGGRWHRTAGWIGHRNVWFRCVAYGLFVRKRVVEKVGLFDEHLGVGSAWGSGEELDYVLRALQFGARIWYEPSLYVIHPRREPNLALAGRLYRYGKGIGRVLRKHRCPILFSLYMLARPLGGAVGSIVLLRPGATLSYVAGAAGRLWGWLRPGPLGEAEGLAGGVGRGSPERGVGSLPDDGGA